MYKIGDSWSRQFAANYLYDFINDLEKYADNEDLFIILNSIDIYIKEKDCNSEYIVRRNEIFRAFESFINYIIDNY